MRLTGMILAAGHGTRLRPLTLERPKPLVPVGDRTMLAHAADNLRRAGVTSVVINTHHLAEQYDADVLREQLELPVHITHEAQIRGTAGGITGAHSALGAGDVVVHNGDILADLDMVELVSRHRSSGALATLALLGGAPAGEGPVGLDAQGAIVRLRDQRFGDEREGAQFIGVHIVSEALRRALPAQGCMVGDVYIPALRASQAIIGAKVVRSFTDVGTPASYLQANLSWLGDRSHFAAHGSQIAATVELQQTVIGAGARVTGSGALTRCVVWPGALAVAPLSDAVVTTLGKVVQEIGPGPS